MTTPGGTSTDRPYFTYAAVPTVTSVSPASGPSAGGTSVAITGTGFSGATAVTFGGTAAAFAVNSTTQITVTTPAHAAGAAQVTVTTAGGTSADAVSFTFIPAPTVSSVAPPRGGTLGGTSVTISGTHFTAPLTSVTFGGAAAASFTVDSTTQITATTPPHAAGAVQVVVTDSGGASTEGVTFTFVSPPTISALSPSSGSVAGGTFVTLTGTNLSGATAVTCDGVEPASYTVDSATQITVTTPARAAGSCRVTVTTPGGTSTDSVYFTFVAAPTVASVSPATGTIGGGAGVTITGTGFSGATSVTFGGTAAASYSVTDATHINATTPPHAAGAVQVVVTNAAGTSADAVSFTYYVPAPTASWLSPTNGPAAGGTSVTITGTNLTAATAVSFGGAAAATYTVDSATQITATTPAHAAGAAQVTVTTAGGTSADAVSFTFVAAPTVSSASPSSGATGGGTSVTITGTSLTGATAVTFGGTAAASFTVGSATQITATTPAHAAGAAQVVVTTAGGTSADAVTFTFAVPAPTLASLSPSAGPVAGGTAVTIVGTNLTGATAVTFGGTAAASFSVDSATRISATAPAHAAGAEQVSVTTTGGTSAQVVTFTFAAAPTVTAVSPTSGRTAGGTRVTITGTNLAGASDVSFGETTAASFTVDSATQITATTQDSDPGAAQVTVTTPGGTSIGAVTFTFVAPVPSVSTVSPSSGPLAGGTAVTITGTGFTDATAVAFGGTAAASFTLVSDTRIAATTPARAAGAAQVTVTTGGGTSADPVAFTFVVAPTVTGVGPASGPAGGGTNVTITGTGFSGVNEVRFGGVLAPTFLATSATVLTATTPAHAVGVVAVTVSALGGTSAASVSFSYLPTPGVTALAPAGGPVAGGTALTITGTSFTGATAVSFGGAAARSYAVVGATRIDAVSPAHAAGAVTVTVTTAYGTSVEAATFTFFDPPTVSAVSPLRGPLAGGTPVTITGTALDGATAVTFGGTTAAFTVANATRIAATTPANVVGAAVVTVATPGGTTSGSVSFSYVAPPVVSALRPSTGAPAGGTSILIEGSALDGALVVRFGDTIVPFTVIDVARLDAVAPPHAAGTVPVTVMTDGGVSGGSISFTYELTPESGAGGGGVPGGGGGGGGGGIPGSGGVGQTGPGAIVALPSEPSPIELTVTGQVNVQDDGIVTAPVLLTTPDGDATMRLPLGLAVRTASGGSFGGTLYAPVAVVDPTGSALLAAFDLSASEPVTFSAPITVEITASDEVCPPFECQPVRVNESGSLAYLWGRQIPGGVAFVTDHLSVYGLVRIPRVEPVSAGLPFALQDGPHSAWAGQSAPVTLEAGRRIDVAVLLRNTGDVPWSRGTFGADALLGSAAPLGTTRDVAAGVVVAPLYNDDRYAFAAESTVAPGDVGTFWVRLRAPLASGTYAVPVRPVIDGLSWLEDEGIYLTLAVP